MPATVVTFDANRLGATYGLEAWKTFWTHVKPGQMEDGASLYCGDLSITDYAIAVESSDSRLHESIKSIFGSSAAYKEVSGKKGVFQIAPLSLQALLLAGEIRNGGQYNNLESDWALIALNHVRKDASEQGDPPPADVGRQEGPPAVRAGKASMSRMKKCPRCGVLFQLPPAVPLARLLDTTGLQGSFPQIHLSLRCSACKAVFPARDAVDASISDVARASSGEPSRSKPRQDRKTLVLTTVVVGLFSVSLFCFLFFVWPGASRQFEPAPPAESVQVKQPISIPSPPVSESHVFGKARKEDSIQAYRDYLERFPGGRFADEAARRINVLSACDEAHRAGSIAAWRSFLERHGDTGFAARAREEIDKLALTEAMRSYEERAGPDSVPLTVRDRLQSGDRAMLGLSPAEKEVFVEILVERLRVDGTAHFSIEQMQPEARSSDYRVDSSIAVDGGVGRKDDGEYDLEFDGMALPPDGNLLEAVMLGRGRTKALRIWLQINRLPYRASMLIGDTQDGPSTASPVESQVLAVSTVLPGDRIGYFTASRERSGVVLPVADGSIYGLEGRVDAIVPGIVFCGDREDPLYFVLLKGLGLTYVAGRGFVRLQDGRCLALPGQEEVDAASCSMRKPAGQSSQPAAVQRSLGAVVRPEDAISDEPSPPSVPTIPEASAGSVPLEVGTEVTSAGSPSVFPELTDPQSVAVIEKYFRARGGISALSSIRTRSEVLRITTMTAGQASCATVKRWMKTASMLREDWHFDRMQVGGKDLEFAQGYDGKGGWVSMLGKVSALEGSPLALFLYEKHLDDLFLHLSRQGQQLKYLGPERWQDREAEQVLLADARSAGARHFLFDRETGLLLKQSWTVPHPNGDKKFHILYKDWKSFPLPGSATAVLMCARMDRFEDDSLAGTTSIGTIVLNEEVPNGLFRKP